MNEHTRTSSRVTTDKVKVQKHVIIFSRFNKSEVS